MDECKHGSKASGKMIRELPESQGGPGRHKCAHCAYNQGVEDALEAVGEAIASNAKELLEARLNQTYLKSIK